MSLSRQQQTQTGGGATVAHGVELRRKCACGKNTAGGECGSCERNRSVSVRRAVVESSRGGDARASEGASVHDVLNSTGHPFDTSTRTYMESRFGQDFSRVPARSAAANGGAISVVAEDHPSEREADRIARRVTQMSANITQPPTAARGLDFGDVRLHTDARASESALALNARAYSVGDDIVFARGQYNPSSPTGRELIAHELAHVVQSRAGGAAASSDALHMKTFETDATACTATIKYLVQLLFQDSGSDTWDATRKATFRNGFKQSIESSFNGNSFNIKPAVPSFNLTVFKSGERSCPCVTQGFKPKVQIDLVKDGEWSTSEDWEVDVEANSAGDFITSNSSRSYGNMDEADLTPEPKGGAPAGVTQVPAVHEFGHFIGLDHPGAGLEGGIFSSSKLSPGADKYTHTGTDVKGRAVNGPTDLMGTGMGLQPFYFDNWRNELTRKYGGGCRWSTA
jgi:hypothetical protein